MDAVADHALTANMVVLLCLVLFTMAMFMFNRISSDLVALIVLIALGLTGLVPTDHLFDGFSGSAFW